MCLVNNLDCLIKWMCKNIFPETIYTLNCDQVNNEELEIQYVELIFLLPFK